MKIVVYGASGRVGSAFERHVSPDHDLLLVDREVSEDAGARFVAGDVRDPAMFHETLVGADASVYLPFALYEIDPDRCDAKFGASFDVNARGVYYWLAAARKHGVGRLVFTSSLSVYGAVMSDGLTSQTPAYPEDVYGLTKMFAEDTCRYFVRKHTMNLVVLRLCSVHTPESWMSSDKALPRRPGNRARASKIGSRTHVDDVAEAIRLALVRPLHGFNLFHIFGEAGVRDWPTDAAREQLGFTPNYPTFGKA